MNRIRPHKCCSKLFRNSIHLRFSKRRSACGKAVSVRKGTEKVSQLTTLSGMSPAGASPATQSRKEFEPRKARKQQSRRARVCKPPDSFLLQILHSVRRNQTLVAQSAESRSENRWKLRALIGILSVDSQSLEVERSSGSDTATYRESSTNPGSNAERLF